VGNGKEIYSTHIGTFTGLIPQEDGTTTTVMLKDTYLVPDLWVNLFSLTKALTKEDTQLSNKEEFIKVTSEDYSIKFDRKLSYGKGHLLAVDMISKAKVKPAADTMFENLIIKNTIWKNEGMNKDLTVIRSNCYGVSKCRTSIGNTFVMWRCLQGNIVVTMTMFFLTTMQESFEWHGVQNKITLSCRFALVL